MKDIVKPEKAVRQAPAQERICEMLLNRRNSLAELSPLTGEE